MKNNLFGFFFICVFAIGCQQADQGKIQELQTALKNANNEITKLKTSQSNALVHIVYLNLKEDANEEIESKVIAEIKKLAAIPEVKNLEVGDFEDLGDQRALSQYDIIFQMDFKNPTAYHTYQAHPTHLELKKTLGKYLAGPPATYDFVKD